SKPGAMCGEDALLEQLAAEYLVEHVAGGKNAPFSEIGATAESVTTYSYLGVAVLALREHLDVVLGGLASAATEQVDSDTLERARRNLEQRAKGQSARTMVDAAFWHVAAGWDPGCIATIP